MVSTWLLSGALITGTSVSLATPVGSLANASAAWFTAVSILEGGKVEVGVASAPSELSFKGASSASDDVSVQSIRSNSFKSTPSLITTVSNCAKGLFTKSFMVLSGVNDILSRPSMIIGSPVLTSTLLRALTLITLNVPSPFSLTCLSSFNPTLSVSNIVATKFSASFKESLFLLTRAIANSRIPTLLFIFTSIFETFLNGSRGPKIQHEFRWN